jgi:peptidoglycan/LPS O-acetylase OafA/YrhL
VTNGFFTRLASTGAWGVELFFFLSGWLLASIYETQGDHLGKQYWYRRISRILPLWTLFLGVEIVRHYLNLGGTLDYILRLGTVPLFFHLNQVLVIIITTLTFTLWFSGVLWNGVIPGGWSIQAEVGHYLIFPLIRNRSLTKVFGLLSVLNIVTFLLNYSQKNNFIKIHFLNLSIDAWMRLNLYATLGYFLLGVLSYKFIQNYKIKANLFNAFSSLGLNIYVLCLYFLTWLCLPITFAHHGEVEILAFVLFFISLARIFMKIRLLRNIFQIFGRYSYFIYFCHFQALELATRLFKHFNSVLNFSGSFALSFFIYFIFAMGLSCLLAVPSEKFIEKPFMNLGRRV